MLVIVLLTVRICNKTARNGCGYFLICKIFHPPSYKIKQNFCAPIGMHAGLRICMCAFLRSMEIRSHCRGPPSPHQFQKNDEEDIG